MTGSQLPSTLVEAARRIDSVGNYKLTGTVLGKGHFARVEEAIHMLLNVKVAIKIFDLQRMTDKYMQQHLRREAVILAKLSHPSVVALYEVHETESHYFLVEEIGEGGNLSQFVKSQKNRRLEEKRARLFCRQLISALAHLHRRGVIHRDLKMENILLDKTKELVKLADFGLSNAWTPNCFLATHCGSPEYAAPELFVYNKRYGPEIDIWSLGVVFYAMVMGKLPFSAPKRANETNDENRTRLVSELKLGLSQRHKNEMLVCNVYFKTMISKMLVPAAKDRIPINQLLAFVGYSKLHSSMGEFPEPEDTWKQSALEKISYEMNIPLDELCTKLQTQPQSSLGGIYNIRRHSHLLRQLNLSPLSRHVSFRAIPSPPITKSNLVSQGSSLAPMKSSASKAIESDTVRSTRYRILRENPVNDNKDVITRSITPNPTAIPQPSTRPRSSALRKPLEGRCKTATSHAEAYQQMTTTRTSTRPLTAGNNQLKYPTIMGNTTLGRRSVPVAKRYASDRTATMRNVVSVPERPRTTGLISINNENHSTRPCSVDCSDIKGRRLSGGIPTHTAARAALRLAKSVTTGNEPCTTINKIAETRRAKLRDHVRNTLDTLSRSFTKFVYPSKRGKGSGEGENTGTVAYTRRKVLETKDADNLKTIDTMRNNVESNIGVKRTSLAFWRRPKP